MWDEGFWPSRVPFRYTEQYAPGESALLAATEASLSSKVRPATLSRLLSLTLTSSLFLDPSGMFGFLTLA